MAVESDIRALPTRGILLFFMKPACWAKPTRVPAVSKKVTKRKVKTTTHICRVLISPMWVKATPKVGFRLGAADTIPCGTGIRPVTNPTTAVTTIPIKMAPGTRRTIKTAVTTKPTTVNQVLAVVKEPNPTTVDLLATTKPPWCKPMKAIKRPIPAEMANFRSDGIASMMISRSLKIVIKTKMIEATKTPAKAVCQLIPIPMTAE